MSSQLTISVLSHDRIAARLQKGVVLLVDSHRYADDSHSSSWDFAVGIRCLRKTGFNDNDLRWLIQKGFAEHACEVTIPGDKGRSFRNSNCLTFYRNSCFVLTTIGAVELAHAFSDYESQRKKADIAHLAGPQDHSPSVNWNPVSKKLTVNGQVVKRFRWTAVNQERILDAFQEEGWPARIDDPLPPEAELDPRRRLNDTIKCLNRKLINPLIQFHGDGTGEGVCWEFADTVQVH